MDSKYPFQNRAILLTHSSNIFFSMWFDWYSCFSSSKLLWIIPKYFPFIWLFQSFWYSPWQKIPFVLLIARFSWHWSKISKSFKKKIRKTLDISDWSRRSESIDFMANISRSYFFSQPAKHVSVLHDKVQILFAGKLSLRKKIAYKLMESVFWVVKVYTLYVLCIFKILTMNNVIYMYH